MVRVAQAAAKAADPARLDESLAQLVDGLDALHRAGGGERAARVKALRAVGVLALKQRDLEQAESFLEESLALARKLGDEPGMSRATLSLAVIAVAKSDYERATQLNKETIELARAADERRVLSTAINNLGDLALHRGQYDDAAYWTREAVALARELLPVEIRDHHHVGGHEALAHALRRHQQTAIVQPEADVAVVRRRVAARIQAAPDFDDRGSSRAPDTGLVDLNRVLTCEHVLELVHSVCTSFHVAANGILGTRDPHRGIGNRLSRPIEHGT